MILSKVIGKFKIRASPLVQQTRRQWHFLGMKSAYLMMEPTNDSISYNKNYYFGEVDNFAFCKIIFCSPNNYIGMMYASFVLFCFCTLGRLLHYSRTSNKQYSLK